MRKSLPALQVFSNTLWLLTMAGYKTIVLSPKYIAAAFTLRPYSGTMKFLWKKDSLKKFFKQFAVIFWHILPYIHHIQ